MYISVTFGARDGNRILRLRSGQALLHMSGIGESNPLLILGKDAYYQCTNPARLDLVYQTHGHPELDSESSPLRIDAEINSA